MDDPIGWHWMANRCKSQSPEETHTITGGVLLLPASHAWYSQAEESSGSVKAAFWTRSNSLWWASSATGNEDEELVVLLEGWMRGSSLDL